MLLSKLFKGAPDLEIEQLSIDSRLSMKNAIFFCLDGIKYDGHDYIEEAIKNGAKVIVYSKEQEQKFKAIYIKVANVNNTLTKVANKFYNNPNEGMDKYVVLGNYGRCSVASFINYYLNSKTSCGYIGILGIRYNGLELNSSFATLNILDNLKLLDTMKKNGVKACTFEASASALNLQKLDSITPDCVIYTCTNRNSSEFQSSDYYAYIRRYLYTLENDSKVILNIDDESYDELEECFEGCVSYGTSTIADYQIRDIMISKDGINYKLVHEEKTYPIRSSIQGRCNVYNLTAAIVALHQKGYELEDIISYMENVPCVDGVMERVDKEYNVIIDCAYDINSIEEVCKYAGFVRQKNKAIGVISINYSDGDKRLERIMNLCNEYLDVIILTENESLESEVMEILERCDKYINGSRVICIPIRSQAIENAIEIMNENDTLIIIGKGNERFMSMGLGREFYYGDKHYVNKFMEKRRNEEKEVVQ
ncbi:MAG: hypothetical protein IK151_03950 [Erysipelotrichaceae bacterium]|nr:hypothetical protein [Erysipelotrichaceae bacterium]